VILHHATLANSNIITANETYLVRSSMQLALQKRHQQFIAAKRLKQSTMAIKKQKTLHVDAAFLVGIAKFDL